MTFRYLKDAKRLNVYGSDGLKDIQEVKKLMQDGKIPNDVRTLFYQRNRHSTVGMVFRGCFLENLLKNDPEPEEAENRKPNFRSILKQINETNTRQTVYAGMLIYATNTKRFLFVMPRGQGQSYGMLGDNLRENETPSTAVCRVAKDDCDFELEPKCLVTLSVNEIDGTTYYSYLVLSNYEFKPTLSRRFIGSTWRSYEAMGEELKLHPSVLLLFEKDPKLHRLIKPIQVNFETLIDEILHSE